MRSPSAFTITDQFCGAGGSSLGAVAAGAEVVLAMNHWRLAVETHNTNFPNTLHACVDISVCDPRRFPRTTMLITSPECTNHSQAKGIKRKHQGQLSLWEPPGIDPAAERSRATMFDVPRFAECHHYELIIVENVVEARHWILFDEWLRMMHKLDYHHNIVYFNSMFAPPFPCPVPQSRDRMYVVFWKKGNPAPDLRFCPPAFCEHCGKRVEAVQSWKHPTRRWGRYGKNRQYIYRCPECSLEEMPFFAPAAIAIDWMLPTTRIGERKNPLKPKTLRRIELGLHNFQDAFLLQVNKTTDRLRPLVEALPTQTADNSLALVSPFLVNLAHGRDPGRIALLEREPAQTQTTAQSQALVAPFLVSYYGTGRARSVQEAMGTVPTRDRHALVTPPTTERPTVEDCAFRMLQPHEISTAMAFPKDYVVLGNTREKVKQYGNAVTPPVMAMLLKRCIATLQ